VVVESDSLTAGVSVAGSLVAAIPNGLSGDHRQMADRIRLVKVKECYGCKRSRPDSCGARFVPRQSVASNSNVVRLGRVFESHLAAANPLGKMTFTAGSVRDLLRVARSRTSFSVEGSGFAMFEQTVFARQLFERVPGLDREHAPPHAATAHAAHAAAHTTHAANPFHPCRHPYHRRPWA